MYPVRVKGVPVAREVEIPAVPIPHHGYFWRKVLLSVAPNWPRYAYNDPYSSRIPMSDTIKPGDVINDYVFGLAFGGDTAATIPDTLSFPGDTASFTMPNGQTVPLIGLIVIAPLGGGNLVCRPDSVWKRENEKGICFLIFAASCMPGGCQQKITEKAVESVIKQQSGERLKRWI